MPVRNYGPALQYIEEYWPKIIRHRPEDDGTLIGLPHAYLVPDPTQFDEMFYWDTPFMLLGVIGSHYEYLAIGAAENFTYSMNRFNVIPNGSRFYFTSRSQPPLFTQVIRMAHSIMTRAGHADADGSLERWMEAAQREHKTVWLGRRRPHERMVHRGLSRYHDVNYSHFLASCESGWDHSTRCEGMVAGQEAGYWMNYLPVCLNSILYRRELDFVWAAELLGDPQSARYWTEAASSRAETMNELMYDSGQHFFFDYNFRTGARESHVSLAGFYPLWAGLATQEQATAMVNAWLPQFLKAGGLTTTLVSYADRQWAAPNGWAPLQWLVVAGLERYGFTEQAMEVRRRWCDNCFSVFNRLGTMLEKYNVFDIDQEPAAGLYGNVPGFGWSNAVFKDFANRLAERKWNE